MNRLPVNIKHKIKTLREKFSGIPVPVIAMAQELGIKIYESYDFTNTQSGSIKKEDGQFVIYLNGLDSPTRKRFTIAHEMGHFLMHSDYLNQGKESITEIKQPVPILKRPSSSTDVLAEEKKREIEANCFAAELLMPEEKFKEVFSQANKIDEVANTFNVSPSAVTIRAKDLLGLFMI